MTKMQEHKTERREPAHDADADAGLVIMTKDGAEIAVHPTCVRSHEIAGWKVKG